MTTNLPRKPRRGPGWKLQDTKASGGEAVLPGSESMPFVEFMESLALDGLDLTRERDTGRDDLIDLP